MKCDKKLESSLQKSSHFKMADEAEPYRKFKKERPVIFKTKYLDK